MLTTLECTKLTTQPNKETILKRNDENEREKKHEINKIIRIPIKKQ